MFWRVFFRKSVPIPKIMNLFGLAKSGPTYSALPLFDRNDLADTVFRPKMLNFFRIVAKPLLPVMRNHDFSQTRPPKL